METLEIILAPAAQRELKKLGRREQEMVVSTLDDLAIDPRPRGVEKIQGRPKFYRVASGKNHRIIYHIFQERIVIILVIRDRKEAYRSLGDVDGKLAGVLQNIEQEAFTQLRASK